MPYVPKFRTLFKILLRQRDPAMAEALWFEGTWLHDNKQYEDARNAFSHARLLDPRFGGAFYNYAAVTERLKGPTQETIDAWKSYVAAALTDSRQKPDIIEKVRRHITEMEKKAGG